MVMTRPGPPEVLTLQEIEPPRPGPSELLVGLHAAGVNPLDTKLRRRGTFYPEQMPAILGCDGAGVVQAIGAGVDRFAVGDAVLFCHGGIGAHPGNYAQLTTVDQAFAVAKPSKISFAQAAAAPLVMITAWESLFERAGVSSGHTVLIHGGAGGVGHVAVQLARLQGARVLTTVGSEAAAEWMVQLGAEPILYRQQDFVAEVLARTDGVGVDMCLDIIGGEVLERSFAATRLYGDVVTLLEPAADLSWKEARARNLRLSLELMLTPMQLGLRAMQVHQAEILTRCGAELASGRLHIRISQSVPLERAAYAHEQLERGHTLGKLVLRIDVG